MQTELKLPGVYFENQPRQLAPELVRMDIPAFVGFTAAGPLNVPVPLEDFARFRDVFGEEVELAWDDERGSSVFSYLGPAVKAFFRNGGRRCWVVRVAGSGVVYHSFALPSLVATDGSTAISRARAPGPWIEDLRVGTRLATDIIPHARWATLSQDDGTLTAEVIAVPRPLTAGDLLEIELSGVARQLFLFVDRIAPGSGGRRFFGQAAFWSDGSAITTVDIPSDFAAPEIITSVRLLQLDLLVWRERRLFASFPGLAFSSRHPRFWARLPTDDGLFRHPQGRRAPRIPEAERRLLEEASDPRFPLAGPAAPADLYLPLNMPEAADPDLTQGLGQPQGTRLERNGLSDFSWRLFLDGPLSQVGSGALLREAESHYYVRQRPLGGIHSLLPVEEITLVSTPDSIHRGWTRDLPPPSDLLSAPVLAPPEKLDGARRYRFSWTVVEGATSYRLQISSTPDFENPITLYEGPETEADRVLQDDCTLLFYLRVRAFRFGQPGPWSNNRVVYESDFLQCQGPVLAELQLEHETVGSPDLMVWTILGEPDSPPNLPAFLEFELEMGSEADFFSPRLLFRGSAGAYPVPPLAAGVNYFRVRARRGQFLGPWSNTVVLVGRQATNWRLQPIADIAPDLMRIHQGLLRFCAARADLMGILTLPRHFQRRQVESHLAELAPAGRALNRTGPLASLDGPPPLTPGEFWTLSYAALYHPWIASVTERTPGPGAQQGLVDFSPPDGAVCGMLARQALEEGAWIAPANQKLAAIVSLEPRFSLDDWVLLSGLQVNLIVQQTRGFLTLSARTLSRETDLKLINVRRLLILLRKEALRAGVSYVFEPHSAVFRRAVRHRFEMLLSSLYVRGAFAGTSAEEAYRVVADESVNPPQSVDLGRLVVELRVAPAQPLRFLRVRLLQTGPEQLAIKEMSQ